MVRKLLHVLVLFLERIDLQEAYFMCVIVLC
jgi:hypothetical protein